MPILGNMTEGFAEQIPYNGLVINEDSVNPSGSPYGDPSPLQGRLCYDFFLCKIYEETPPVRLRRRGCILGNNKQV